MHFLKTQFSLLQDHQKLITLKIDEIHVKPNITYDKKGIYGFAENNIDESATQIQAFMISSLMGKYKEIVKLIPVSRNSSSFLYNSTIKVLNDLEEIGFEICCITGDNSRVNRGCFKKLIQNSTNQCYFNSPRNSSSRIYILFDAPYMIKCIRNNWLNLKGEDKPF